MAEAVTREHLNNPSKIFELRTESALTSQEPVFQNLTSGNDCNPTTASISPRQRIAMQPAEMAREFFQEHPSNRPERLFCRFGHQTTDARDPWLPKAVAPGRPLWKPLVEVPHKRSELTGSSCLTAVR